MDKLTPKQKEVLDFITGYISEKGYAPATRDIGKGLGFASPGNAHKHLVNLKKLGYISMDEGVSRSIVVRRRGNEVKFICGIYVKMDNVNNDKEGLVQLLKTAVSKSSDDCFYITERTIEIIPTGTMTTIKIHSHKKPEF